LAERERERERERFRTTDSDAHCRSGPAVGRAEEVAVVWTVGFPERSLDRDYVKSPLNHIAVSKLWAFVMA
jgi:hypothetical protein